MIPYGLRKTRGTPHGHDCILCNQPQKSLRSRGRNWDANDGWDSQLDMSEPEFKPFDKIPRLRREVCVTEKIDGTNAIVWISDDLSVVRAGSRTRWITPHDDNHGFAAWVERHKDGLKGLGPGYHYGEWWGQGIQRRYGLSEKRFSLFNATRWADDNVRPKCCHVVPLLCWGRQEEAVEKALERLRREGSAAAPGFMKPEGIVVYHTASRSLFKVTLENDESPKGVAA